MLKNLQEKVARSGDIMTGDINMQGNIVIGLNDEYPPKNATQAVTWSQTKELVFDSAASKLSLNGSEPMVGNLNMNNKKVSNVGLPINQSDATTKQYVDARLLYTKVARFQFTGSDDDKVWYRAAIVDIRDDRFIGIKPENIILSIYCSNPQSPLIDLDSTVSLIGVANNVLSVRIYVENNKKRPWSEVFDAYVRCIILP